VKGCELLLAYRSAEQHCAIYSSASGGVLKVAGNCAMAWLRHLCFPEEFLHDDALGLVLVRGLASRLDGAVFYLHPIDRLAHEPRQPLVAVNKITHATGQSDPRPPFPSSRTRGRGSMAIATDSPCHLAESRFDRWRPGRRTHKNGAKTRPETRMSSSYAGRTIMLNRSQ